MADYWQEAPPILQEYLNYHESILSHSAKTVDEYFLDLRAFFRYMKLQRDPALAKLPFREIYPAAQKMAKRSRLPVPENAPPSAPFMIISAFIPISWRTIPPSP